MQGQIYTTLSRLKTYSNLYWIGESKKSAIKINKEAWLEYERQQNDLFVAIEKNTISDDTLTVLVNIVRSLPKLVSDIISDDKITDNDILRVTAGIKAFFFSEF